jgi:hypothetical protein
MDVSEPLRRDLLRYIGATSEERARMIGEHPSTLSKIRVRGEAGLDVLREC